MDRSELILAALAAAGENATFTPVQVQKLFFLLDREAYHLVEGPHFQFVPYDYGPFDRNVYLALDDLAQRELVLTSSEGRYRVYGLTRAGIRDGRKVLDRLPKSARAYVANIATWVQGLSFNQLVAAIYKRYPEMKVNSVFRE